MFLLFEIPRLNSGKNRSAVFFNIALERMEIKRPVIFIIAVNSILKPLKQKSEMCVFSQTTKKLVSHRRIYEAKRRKQLAHRILYKTVILEKESASKSQVGFSLCFCNQPFRRPIAENFCKHSLQKVLRRETFGFRDPLGIEFRETLLAERQNPKPGHRLADRRSVRGLRWSVRRLIFSVRRTAGIPVSRLKKPLTNSCCLLIQTSSSRIRSQETIFSRRSFSV